MSAICGTIALDGRPVAPTEFTRVLHALTPLGPDGHGSWGGTAGRLGVGVGARLRHHKPEDRHDRQPVIIGGTDRAETDDGLVVVADVVLHRRAELAHVLGVVDRVDLTDSRLIALAYQRWGPACATRLVGEFAFAVADRRRGGVLLVRDQLGIRPLHINRRPGRVSFASTALALTRLDGVGHELDLDRVKEYLALVMVSSRSWIVGIDPVPPATAMWITPTGVRQWRYWQLDPRSVDRQGSFAEHADAMREALDGAVAGCVRGTHAVGVTLSGGLDSTAVAASAARLLSPGPLRAYTSVPPRQWSIAGPSPLDADESPLVRALADEYPNLRPTFLDARGTSFFDDYDEIFAAGGTPPRNVCNVTWFNRICTEAAADGVTLLLGGGGGNMFFSADDPRWLVELLRRGHARSAVREVHDWTAATGATTQAVLQRAVALEVLPAALVEAYRGRRGQREALAIWFSATALRREHRDDVDALTLTGFLDARRGRVMRTEADVTTRGRAAQAEYFAAQEARWGLRFSEPTVDVRLIETAARMPAWSRRHRGWDRAVTREAMVGRLPDAIRLRRRRGAQLPDWLDRMTDARAELRDELDATRDHPVTRRLIDVELLEDAFREWPAPDRATDRSTMYTYRLAMLRSLLASRYVRWFEQDARDLGSVGTHSGTAAASTSAS